MLDRIARTAPAAQLLRLAALCALLSGCAASSVEGPLFFADAGKYQFHNCEQLAAASKRQQDRERELKELIDKAEQAAAGQIVSVLAYRSDYAAVNEDLRVIQATARDKNCTTSAKSKGATR